MKTTLEHLPDEILLLICRYLSQRRIILAFFGLNNRLNRTISQYYRSLIVDTQYYSSRNNRQLLPIIGPYLHSLTIKYSGLSSTEISLASNIRELTFLNTQPVPISVIFQS